MRNITRQSFYKTIYNGYSFTHIYYTDDPAGKTGIPSPFLKPGYPVCRKFS